MLSSIHPLGERSRNNRWWLTVSAFVTGSALGGAGLGAALGGLGTLADDRFSLRPATPALVALCCAVALIAELQVGGSRLLTVRRQVDEDWLVRYRGWVYGLGFGFQLGVGVVTTVVTAAIYLTFALALLSWSVVGGAVVGASFGLVRGLTVLTAARVHDPERLRRFHQRMSARAQLSSRATVAAQMGLLVVALGRAVAR